LTGLILKLRIILSLIDFCCRADVADEMIRMKSK
jgi:hypothetical protein